MPKPCCRACGRVLRKRTYSEEVDAGTPAPTEMYGRKVVKVISRKTLSFRRRDNEAYRERVSVWCGEWGDYGDGRFCGIRCGYRWAVQHAPKAAGA